MDLMKELTEVSRKYRDNTGKRIDVNPASYADFVSLFKQAEQNPFGSLLGIPVYKKNYVPLNMAVLTTEKEVVFINLQERTVNG